MVRWRQVTPFDDILRSGVTSQRDQEAIRAEDRLLVDEKVPEKIAMQVDIAFLHKAMESCLTPRERQVLDLLYREDLNSTEIAARLEISGPRVTQLHQNAVNKLRKALDIIRN